MADETKTLEGLKEAMEGAAATAAAAPVEAGTPEVVPAAPVEPKLDQFGRAYATGKRKDAVARVWIKPGSGKIVVNGREYEKYFARPVLQMLRKSVV